MPTIQKCLVTYACIFKKHVPHSPFCLHGNSWRTAMLSLQVIKHVGSATKNRNVFFFLFLISLKMTPAKPSGLSESDLDRTNSHTLASRDAASHINWHQHRVKNAPPRGTHAGNYILGYSSSRSVSWRLMSRDGFTVVFAPRSRHVQSCAWFIGSGSRVNSFPRGNLLVPCCDGCAIGVG